MFSYQGTSSVCTLTLNPDLSPYPLRLTFDPGALRFALCPPQTIKATSPLGDPRVTYDLEEGQVPETNMPVRFYVKPNRADGSASILVAENLDFETTGFFTLRVRVQNVASVPLASFTTVYVNVTGGCGRPGPRLGCRADLLAPPPLRRKRQRALLPVLHLRGHGS